MKRIIWKISGPAVLSGGLLFAGTQATLAQMQNGAMAGQNQNMNQQQQQQQPGMLPNGMQPNQQNSAEANFVATMRRNSKVETDLSKMAMKNSSNDQVKQLAKDVIAQNRKSDMALTSATSSTGQLGGMSFPAPVPSQTHQAEKQMKKLTGTDFDKMYLSQMDGYVKNDQQTISAASGSLNSGDMGSLTMQLQNTADARAKQIAQVAQSENFKVQ
jgi:predicted outer membrane protein